MGKVLKIFMLPSLETFGSWRAPWRPVREFAGKLGSGWLPPFFRAQLADISGQLPEDAARFRPAVELAANFRGWAPALVSD
jgi:hypothetical protein